MKKVRWDKNFIIFSVVFFLSFIAYLISEGILQSNMKAAVDPNQATDYGRLVDWLPKDAKLAIEYRARYLDLQEKVEKAREVDIRVDAMFNYADYIKQKDKDGSDKVLASVAENPEYRKSRRAYKSLARLLLSKNPYCQLSIKEYHDYIDGLTWDEDKLAAWNAGRAQLNTLRATPQVHLEYLAPLLEKKMIYSNFDNFYANIQTHANKLQDSATVQKATAVREEIKAARRGIPNNIINAPLDFRKRYVEYRNDIENAKDTDARLSATVGLASLLLDKDNAEATRLMAPIRDNPDYVNCGTYYVALARMLLEKRIGKSQIGIADYHNFIKTVKDEPEIIQAWEAGFSQLSSIKASPAVFIEYLKPLLDKTPEYRDYLDLIEQLKNKAYTANNQEIMDKAEAMIQSVKGNRRIRFMTEALRGKRPLN